MINEIKKRLPGIAVEVEESILKKYGKDWTDFYIPNPLAVLFPKSTEDVQKIVELANEYKIGLVPSGGRTGLSGGAVATNRELIVSLEKMDKILSFDPISQMVTVEAGLITQDLQKFAASENLYFPVDLASRGSSQIGGNIATNAGGIKVVRYGLTRNWIYSLTVVTGRGDVLKINNGLLKNATGYDLSQLFIGSEGTLGIITEAIIRLTRAPEDVKVVLLPILKIEYSLKILKLFQEKFNLLAFEFFTHLALTHVVKNETELPFKSSYPYYLLIEIEEISNLEALEEIISDCYSNSFIEEDIIAENYLDAKKIWSYRENITESISKFTPYKNDISLTLTSIPVFIQELDAIFSSEYPEFPIIWFGHIADGNLHINILKPETVSKDIFFQKGNGFAELIHAKVKKYDGSVSAEHGIGLLKKQFLAYTRSLEEINYMKDIKSVFDPNGIMNPGKIF